MNDKLTEVLEQYDMKIIRTYKGRGAIICETDQGIKSLKELQIPISRLTVEYELKNSMIQAGFSKVDQYVNTKEGTLLCYDRYKTPFVMKDYYDGRELDIRNKVELKEASENLARLHKSTWGISLDVEYPSKSMKNVFLKHNQELKRIRNYIKTVGQKKEFEYIFVEYYDMFYKQAEDAIRQLDNLEKEERKSRIGVCHGTYNYHNIIYTEKGLATINFEQFTVNYQILDLYQFLRKALEKNNYIFDYAKNIINGYRKQIELQKEDYHLLYVLLLYPEKFWKISNHYYNNKKSWLPPKSIEKINAVIEKNEEKKKFLKEFILEYLMNF